MRRHRFHGAPERFEVVADLIASEYGETVRYVADVAGGRGALARLLRKSYNYEAEVVDSRGYTLTGVPSRAEEFTAELAPYYDLIVGLHPDGATREVARAARQRRAVLIPCCNFWDPDRRLGGDELISSIADWYERHEIRYRLRKLAFRGPKNVALISEPPAA
jgi:hypothetical protein